MSSEPVITSEAWRALRAGRQEAHGISIPTIVTGITTLDGDLRLALGEQGEARILVPVGLRERLGSFGESPALRVSDATYTQNGKPARFIDLTCMVTELDSVFSEVGEELQRRIVDGVSAQNAVRTTLQDFRALLVRRISREISDQEISGLVGELLILCRLLETNPDAVEAWRGPAGERHDFRRGSHSLEVKTTSRTGNQSVSISSIDQLDAPGGGDLHLAYIVLERDVDGPCSVVSLAARAAAMSSSPDLISEYLGLVGCGDPQDDDWNRLSFVEEAVTVFEVRDGFPRINSACFASGALPEGITAIEYTIDLAQASEFALCENDAADIFAGVAG